MYICKTNRWQITKLVSTCILMFASQYIFSHYLISLGKYILWVPMRCASADVLFHVHVYVIYKYIFFSITRKLFLEVVYGALCIVCIYIRTYMYIKYNLNGSNTDGSYTVDDSNSFFSPYKILPIAQENKYLGIFSYLIMELYVVCTH